jgi:hypothetical protein
MGKGGDKADSAVPIPVRLPVTSPVCRRFRPQYLCLQTPLIALCAQTTSAPHGKEYIEGIDFTWDEGEEVPPPIPPRVLWPCAALTLCGCLPAAPRAAKGNPGEIP